MKKQNIIKKNKEFELIIKNRKRLTNNYFNIYYIEEIFNKYGISVPKKYFKTAVLRNKIKRQLKDIIDKNDVPNGYEYVIIVKEGLINLNYKEIKLEFLNLIYRLKEKKNEK